MKQAIIIALILFSSCNQGEQIQRKIRGKWYYDDSDTYIRISGNEYTVRNDSPIPEDYKFIGDSIVVKGFEASLFPGKYVDTLEIIRLTDDTLIFKTKNGLLVLFKR